MPYPTIPLVESQLRIFVISDPKAKRRPMAGLIEPAPADVRELVLNVLVNESAKAFDDIDALNFKALALACLRNLSMPHATLNTGTLQSVLKFVSSKFDNVVIELRCKYHADGASRRWFAFEGKLHFESIEMPAHTAFHFDLLQ